MNEFVIYKADVNSHMELPFAEEGVRAGFPSPAQDYMSESIDLNRDLIQHSESTFYARATGDSLQEANIHEGDILVVDKSLEPGDGDMAVCCVEGEFTLKFIEKHEGYLLLCPANSAYKPIKILPDDDFTVWGIVTYVIHKVKRRQ
jgi:DNA polymerase V